MDSTASKDDNAALPDLNSTRFDEQQYRAEDLDLFLEKNASANPHDVLILDRQNSLEPHQQKEEREDIQFLQTPHQATNRILAVPEEFLIPEFQKANDIFLKSIRLFLSFLLGHDHLEDIWPKSILL